MMHQPSFETFLVDTTTNRLSKDGGNARNSAQPCVGHRHLSPVLDAVGGRAGSRGREARFLPLDLVVWDTTCREVFLGGMDHLLLSTYLLCES